MKKLTVSVVVSLLLTLALTSCTCEPCISTAEEKETPLVVFLVRHGEKVDSSDDAELSPAGRQRAADLAHTLRSAGIEYVHSSDYTRCRDTAQPTTSMLGLEVQLYDPMDLPTLVEKLRMAKGRHLVVGHSNTTPLLAKMLCNSSEPVADEEGEYGRLYIVTAWKDGKADSEVVHFGDTDVAEEG